MLDSKEDARYATSGAIHVPAGEGATSWFSGDTYTIKASEESTHGSLGLVPPAWGVERFSTPEILRFNEESRAGGCSSCVPVLKSRLHPRPLAAAEQLGELDGFIQAGRLRAADAGLARRSANG
jgi:hypothetical protein